MRELTSKELENVAGGWLRFFSWFSCWKPKVSCKPRSCDPKPTCDGGGGEEPPPN